MKHDNEDEILTKEEIEQIAKKMFLNSEDSYGCVVKDIFIINTPDFSAISDEPEVILIVGEGDYPYSPDWSVIYSMDEINSFNKK